MSTVTIITTTTIMGMMVMIITITGMTIMVSLASMIDAATALVRWLCHKSGVLPVARAFTPDGARR